MELAAVPIQGFPLFVGLSVAGWDPQAGLTRVLALAIPLSSGLS